MAVLCCFKPAAESWMFEERKHIYTTFPRQEVKLMLRRSEWSLRGGARAGVSAPRQRLMKLCLLFCPSSCIAAHPPSYLLLLCVLPAVSDPSLSSLLLSSLSSSAALLPPPLPHLVSLSSAATSNLRYLTLSWRESAQGFIRPQRG